MSGTSSDEKPLKTWSYLSGSRRRPSEYEVVSTGLHYHTLDEQRPWEVDPNIPMAEWYRQYCYGSPLKHEDWDNFRDPDEMIYRTYNIVQDGQENYVTGLFDQFNDRGHDQMLAAEWVEVLAECYTPMRYPLHGMQMGAAYLSQIAPASTISNCATYTAADQLRWVTHTAYRTRELANAFPDLGFGERERALWEEADHWQGFRELIERVLVTWDWAEAFTAIMLVAKPALEETLMTQFGQLGRSYDDTLIGLLTQAQMRDAERHRRWSGALVEMADSVEGNGVVIDEWINKWSPLAENAIDKYCSAFGDAGIDMAADAKSACTTFRRSLSVAEN